MRRVGWVLALCLGRLEWTDENWTRRPDLNRGWKFCRPQRDTKTGRNHSDLGLLSSFPFGPRCTVLDGVGSVMGTPWARSLAALAYRPVGTRAWSSSKQLMTPGELLQTDEF